MHSKRDRDREQKEEGSSLGKEPKGFHRKERCFGRLRSELKDSKESTFSTVSSRTNINLSSCLSEAFPDRAMWPHQSSGRQMIHPDLVSFRPFVSCSSKFGAISPLHPSGSQSAPQRAPLQIISRRFSPKENRLKRRSNQAASTSASRLNRSRPNQKNVSIKTASCRRLSSRPALWPGPLPAM